MGEEKDKIWINFWYGLLQTLLRCADSGGVLEFESATSRLDLGYTTDCIMSSNADIASTGKHSRHSSYMVFKLYLQ